MFDFDGTPLNFTRRICVEEEEEEEDKHTQTDGRSTNQKTNKQIKFYYIYFLFRWRIFHFAAVSPMKLVAKIDFLLLWVKKT